MNKGATNDLKDEIECAVSALCGKSFVVSVCIVYRESLHRDLNRDLEIQNLIC